MKRVNPNELDAFQKKIILNDFVAPRPVALVSTKNTNDTINLGVFSYFSIASTNPLIVSISVIRKENEMKDTAVNILREKEAVVHIVLEDIANEANKVAMPLDRNVSELDLTNFTTTSSNKISTPSISEAKIRLESKLNSHLEVKDADGNVVADLLLLEVIEVSYPEEAYGEDGRVDLSVIKPIGRFAGNYYMNMGERIEIVRPGV